MSGRRVLNMGAPRTSSEDRVQRLVSVSASWSCCMSCIISQMLNREPHLCLGLLNYRFPFMSELHAQFFLFHVLSQWTLTLFCAVFFFNFYSFLNNFRALVVAMVVVEVMILIFSVSKASWWVIRFLWQWVWRRWHTAILHHVVS